MGQTWPEDPNVLGQKLYFAIWDCSNVGFIPQSFLIRRELYSTCALDENPDIKQQIRYGISTVLNMFCILSWNNINTLSIIHSFFI